MSSARKRIKLTNKELDEIITNWESGDEISDFSNIDSQSSEEECGRENGEAVGNAEIMDNAEDVENTEAQVRDAQSFIAETIFGWVKNADYSPHIFDFDNTGCGITPDIEFSENPTESEIFKHLFDADLVEHIVYETDKYYSYITQTFEVKEHSKLKNYTRPTLSEMYTFLAASLLMAHTSKNRLKDYWSTDPLLSTPMFAKMFSQNRFLLILRLLHFSDSQNQPNGDRLYKISAIVETLKMKFKSLFVPYKNLCIDESIMVWKGRLSFKQYVPTKRHRFGIKLFVLCDCQTGYVVDFLVYTGAATNIDENPALGISGSVVATLLAPYLGKGHSLFTDNWYTSPQLCQYLFEHKTGACGTVRQNRKKMPKFPQKVAKGECIAYHTTTMLAEKWHDRRDVCMLSTIHKHEMKETKKKDHKSGNFIKKPSSVLNYNTNMGLVDKCDMQISYLDSTRKSLKWYKKLFFHILDVTVYNSYILYKLKTGQKLRLVDFRLNLIRQLLEEYMNTRTPPRGGRPSTASPVTPDPLRLTGRHFPEPVPSTATKKTPQRQCFVCKHTGKRPQKRRDTRWFCSLCNVGLCVFPCFQDYHTVKNF